MKRLFKKCKGNALKMFKIFLALVIVATEVLSPMVVMANTKELPKMEKGDVYNPLTNTASDSASVTVGQLINEGDVSVVKTVKKTDVLGRYEVSFEVKGKNTVTNTPVTKPLYVVIVLDRSGSMVCDDTKDGYSYVVNKDAHYVAADGVGIACLDSYRKRNPSALIKDKWESAIDGAIEFSDSLVEKANTYVSLVTFSGTATEATDFRSNNDVVENQSIFAKSEFGHPQGSTNLKDAIAKAYKKLNAITTTDAQKYIVVIGDGEPTEGGNSFCNHTCSAKKQSTIAKNNGINIYSIGYGVDKNATAQEVLKYISSNTLVTSQNPTGYEIGTYIDNGYYLEATTSGIVNSFKTIFDNINVSLAGTNASLKDHLGGKFTFTIGDSNVTDNGRSYTYNIGDIKEEGTKFSFFIDIDQDSPTGLYDTNDGFTLSYTDANGISKELPCSTNPQVYWEQNTYPYEIRYYKDEITNVNDATTYLGNVEGQAAHNANINVSLTKYIPEGYVSLVTNPTSLTVDKTKENIVNVLYVKRSD
ncbi:MAG: VWA domain-containing protein, partial [Bacilli bacterium]